MKIRSATAYNFKGFDTITVNFDENITYLVGPNGAGKSGMGIDLIWFVLQGIAEKSSGGNVPLLGERFRFIGGTSAASIGEIQLYDEKVEIKVIRKMLKSGSELSFSTMATNLKLDQKWLNDLFNVFFIAPKRFLDLSSKEQALTLGIDTKKWDDGIRDLKTDVTVYNKDIEKIENLPPIEKTEWVLLKDLNEQMQQLQKDYVQQHQANQQINKETKAVWQKQKGEWDLFVADFNRIQVQKETDLTDIFQALITLKNLGYEGTEVEEFRNNWVDKILPQIYAENFYPEEPTDLQYKQDDYTPAPGEKVYIRELPDQKAIAELQGKILMATETNVKAKAYDDYQLKIQEKEDLQKKLADNKKKQVVLEEEKLEYIKAFKLPFDKLSIGDEGELLFNGRPLKIPHYSTGELIRIIPTLLSSLNPKLKYVFLQDFSLLDEVNQEKIVKELTDLGFQLVVELVGNEPPQNKNCIVLRHNHVVNTTKADQTLLIEAKNLAVK